MSCYHPLLAVDAGLKENGGHYDDKGRVVLEEIGRVNLYDEIQSHADSVDIHVLMQRYKNGDPEALSRAQGLCLDATVFPKTYAEALNHMADMERSFMSLPAEVRERFNNSFSEFLASSCESDFMERLGLVESGKQPLETKPAIPAEEGKTE
jgi:hypothetical protein